MRGAHGLRKGASSLAADEQRPAATIRDEEVSAILDIFHAYGRPLGASGVVLGTAVVTPQNERRVRLVMSAMERRGLIRVKHPARTPDHDDIYEVNDGE